MQKLAYRIFTLGLLVCGPVMGVQEVLPTPGFEAVPYIVFGGGILILGLSFGRHKRS